MQSYLLPKFSIRSILVLTVIAAVAAAALQAGGRQSAIGVGLATFVSVWVAVIAIAILVFLIVWAADQMLSVPSRTMQRQQETDPSSSE